MPGEDLERLADVFVAIGAALLTRLRRLLGGTGHIRGVTSRMPDGMHDDLGFPDLVENQIRVRGRRHPPDGRIVGAAADVGMQQ